MSTDDEELLNSLRVTGSEDGDQMARLYTDLRTVANRLMSQERANHTLQPTALVHEAFLRIGEGERLERLEYLAMAARVMRRVLIDHARSKNAEKRGGDWKRITLQGVGEDGQPEEELDVLLLDDSLARLAELDERQARIVELRFFSGMTGQEIADHMGISRNTVVRELTMARAWLHRAISEGE